MNTVQLTGNLTKSPVKSDKADLIKFTLAVTDRFRDKNNEWSERTSFINCTAWGRAGDGLLALPKGASLFVAGSIETGSYVDKTGVTKYTTDIRVAQWQPLGKKEKTAPSGTSKPTVEPTEYDSIPF